MLTQQPAEAVVNMACADPEESTGNRGVGRRPPTSSWKVSVMKGLQVKTLKAYTHYRSCAMASWCDSMSKTGSARTLTLTLTPTPTPTLTWSDMGASCIPSHPMGLTRGRVLVIRPSLQRCVFGLLSDTSCKCSGAASAAAAAAQSCGPALVREDSVLGIEVVVLSCIVCSFFEACAAFLAVQRTSLYSTFITPYVLIQFCDLV